MKAHNHYEKANLLKVILQQLKLAGYEAHQINRELLSKFDEFHLQGAKVSLALAKTLQIQPNQQIIDVGCGIGGAARMLAEVFQCQVTGVDITPSYIETAIALSQLVKLDHKTHFIIGNAINLPFGESKFDIVWTQHVQMNIENKRLFYREMQAVLKVGGYLLYYDIFLGENTNLKLPVPWAEAIENNHLISHDDVAHFFGKNFKQVQTIDFTDQAIKGLEKALEFSTRSSHTTIGLNLLMGNSTQEKLQNLLHNLIRKSVEVHAAIYQKI